MTDPAAGMAAVPPTPTTMRSLAPAAPSSKPRAPPSAMVRAPDVPESVSTSARELTIRRVPAPPMVIAETPLVPKPACRTPCWTDTVLWPEFQATDPGSTSVPCPVLMRLPVPAAPTEARVSEPAA